jgi:hypothetical protein
MSNYLPFDNCGMYQDKWKACSNHLGKLKTIGIKSPKILKSTVHADQYLIQAETSIDGLDILDVCTYMLLFRYKSIVQRISKKVFEPVGDFFNELESNCEYHARQLYVLATSNKHELENKLESIVLSFTPTNLDPLDLAIFELHRDSQENPYDIWVLNHIMIFMAQWEVKQPGLFKEDYINAIVSDNTSSLPSSIRMLSRVVNKKKEKVLELYPMAVLMNYSHFYPIDLYHTGKEPIVKGNSLPGYTELTGATGATGATGEE